MFSGKDVAIHFIAGLIKRMLLHRMSYYPEPQLVTPEKNKSCFSIFLIMHQNLI